MRTRLLALFALVPLAAFAAEPTVATTPIPVGPANHWSLAAGETVSQGTDALDFEMGWPGVSVGFLHGLSDRADVGVKFDLLYGVEDTTSTRFGFGLGVPLRIVASRKDKLSVLLHVDPGLRTYAGQGNADFQLR